MTRTIALVAATAIALAVSPAAAAGKPPAKPPAARVKGAATGMPSDNDVLSYVCGLIPVGTSERKRCMEGASMGKGRQRGVRPR